MKGKLLQNLSANTLQLVINQVFGLVIFYILSTNLDKDHFGQLNLALAILLAAFNVLSFGIDQVTVRKIASGQDPKTLLNTYLNHVLLTGLLFYGLLIIARLVLAVQFQPYQLLLTIGFGKLLIYFATPFKQLANGFEQFGVLTRMSVVSNIVRGVALIVMGQLHAITLTSVAFVFIAGDVAELLLTVALFKYKLKVPISLRWNGAAYVNLIREAMPQMGVVIFTSALARFDWIFIGVFVSAVKLAEYSFAYKVFELATLPLLAVAPLLVPKFTQLFNSADHRIDDLRFLLRMEMIVSSFIIVVLNICWAPLVDGITGHKYGSVNSQTFFILSLSMPFIYFNNFLWSINFAKGRLKMILWVIGLTFIINLCGDVLLIPFFKNEGAAVAYLIAMLTQAASYFKKGKIEGLNTIWLPLVLTVFCAIICVLASNYMHSNMLTTLILLSAIYVVLLLATMQLRPGDAARLLRILNLRNNPLP